MAEIRLKKRKKPLWPWAVGLIIVLTLSWGVFESLRYRERTNKAGTAGLDHTIDRSKLSKDFAFDSGEAERNRNENDIHEFVRFSKDAGAYGSGNIYEAEGLQKLAFALEALSFETGGENSDVLRKLSSLKSRSDFMLMHGNAHGDSARVAMTEAVDIFKIIQQEVDPNGHELIRTLDESIKSYNPSGSEDIHKRQMEDFFEKSAMAVDVLWNKK